MSRAHVSRWFSPRVLVRVLVCLFVLGGGSGARTAWALPTGARDPQFEAEIARELEARAPDAVPIFQRATAAWDAKDYPSALEQYSRVLERAPGFAHAERRKCGALAALDRRSEALAFCRAAVAQDASPVNEAALAMALLSAKGEPPAADLAEAKNLASRAAHAKPDDFYMWATLAQVSFQTRDLPTAREAVAKLQALAPDDPAATIFGALLAANDGDFARAEALLARARTAGLPPSTTDALATAIEEARGPWWLRAAKGLGRALVIWVVVLLLLLGAAQALSRATLRTLATQPIGAHVRPSELRLRKIYRAVLWVACAYYYASLPLVAVAVVVATAGVIWGVVAAGFIAPKLFIVLGLLGFGSLASIARSLLLRAHAEDPGLVLDLGENPKMRAVLDEVAARIGTRPVDRVFVTPFTDVAVFDRGSLGAQLRGSRDRCLILGAGVLDGMRLSAFKSVLAHEYGHFHNEDTAGGGFALAVRRSLSAMTLQLIARRAASPLNPAWWFVRGFWRAFLSISQGASRLQEVLADRWAAFAYGSDAFVEGLRHVIERTVRFNAHVNRTVDEVVKTRSALPNLYAFVPASPAPEGDLDKAIAEAFAKKPTPFDSHPCPEDRLARVKGLAFGAGAAPEDGDDAWSLFADRAALEARMTAEVRARLQKNRGVTVPAA